MDLINFPTHYYNPLPQTHTIGHGRVHKFSSLKFA